MTCIKAVMNRTFSLITPISLDEFSRLSIAVQNQGINVIDPLLEAVSR